MIQPERNKLYNLAFGLDNKPRVLIPKVVMARITTISPDEVTRRRFKDKLKGMFIVLTEEDLAAIAQEIRNIVSFDEERISKGGK